MPNTPSTSQTRRYDSLNGKDEYTVVRMRPGWGLVSIFVFVYSLPIRYWIKFLPWHPHHYWSRPGTMILATLALSTLGMILAWIGLRTADPRATDKSSDRGGSGLSSAKMGLFLNGAVFAILALAVSAGVIYWRFIR